MKKRNLNCDYGMRLGNLEDGNTTASIATAKSRSLSYIEILQILSNTETSIQYLLVLYISYLFSD